jgi:hypothetical protein
MPRRFYETDQNLYQESFISYIYIYAAKLSKHFNNEKLDSSLLGYIGCAGVMTFSVIATVKIKCHDSMRLFKSVDG